MSSDAKRYGELAHCANRIDAAVYDTVSEAIFGWENPAAEINLSLSLGGERYGEMLLRSFRESSLSEIASLPDVKVRVDEVRRRAELGLAFLHDRIRLEAGQIAVADVAPPSDVTVNRYSPYSVFPEARYSVTLTRTEHDARLTAMRNPWRDFESVDLGAIFRNHGGGGHQRVGSTVLRAGDERDPAQVLAAIVDEISRADRRDAAVARIPA